MHIDAQDSFTNFLFYNRVALQIFYCEFFCDSSKDRIFYAIETVYFKSIFLKQKWDRIISALGRIFSADDRMFSEDNRIFSARTGYFTKTVYFTNLSNIFDFLKVSEHEKITYTMKRGWMISPFDQISIFDLKLEKWPFGVKFLWRLKGRQTYLEWFGIPNVVEWYPFRPGFNLILKNGRKSYLGLPTVEKCFFEPYSEQPWDTLCTPIVSILNS